MAKVPFIHPKKIEESAEGCLGRYEQAYGKIVRPPVPIENMLDCLEDISIRYEDLASA